MKSKIALTAGLIAGVLAALNTTLIAGEVTGLISFTVGAPAKASEVNGNFSAVKTAVDNNNSRITTLESGAASPIVTGNITLVPSTPSAGNILKGTVPFIHNFGTDNIFIGVNAGNFTMTGTQNTASGMNALQSNMTGNNNTASGFSALVSNTIIGRYSSTDVHSQHAIQDASNYW